MFLLYNSIGGTWNTATSCFAAPMKYCQDNNISWNTTSKLAQELAFISVWGPLAAVRETGEAAMTAVVDSVTETIAHWAYSAKDIVSDATHCALATAHAWTLGTSTGDGASATMVAGLAAGIKALDLGYGAITSAYTMVSSKAVKFTLDVNTTLNQLEDRLQCTGLFEAADSTVSTPCAFGWDEDGDVAADESLHHGFDEHGAGAHAFAASWEDLMPSPDDFAMDCVVLAGVPVDFTENCAALPLC